MKEKTHVKKMVVLDGGSFLYETGMMLMGQGLDTHQRIPTPYFAFDTTEGWILFDTGWSPEIVPVLEDLGMAPRISKENMVTRQLEKIGVSPKDISKVIISHLHVDHAGGLKYLSNARIYVQKDEFSFAKYPNSFQKTIYDPNTFALPENQWELLQGDKMILPGLTTILANGHTPGLQALVVELPESGYHVLSADAVYLEENLKQDHPPGLVWNAVLAQYSIARLKALQSILGGRLYPGHDEDFYHAKVEFGKAYL